MAEGVLRIGTAQITALTDKKGRHAGGVPLSRARVRDSGAVPGAVLLEGALAPIQ